MKSLLIITAIVSSYVGGVLLGAYVSYELSLPPPLVIVHDWKAAALDAVAELRYIKHFDDGDYTGYASATVIDTENGLAMTCAHVVRDSQDLSVDLPNGESATVTVLAQYDDLDIAIVTVPPRTFRELPLAPEGSEVVGDVVYTLGYPRDVGLTLSSGLVSGLHRSIVEEEDRTLCGLVQHSCPASAGDSGGPLLDSQGRVLGLNVALCATGACITYTIPASQLRASLASYRLLLLRQ